MRVVSLPRALKLVTVVAFDITALWVAFWAAYALRFGQWSPPQRFESLSLGLAATALVTIAIAGTGGYRPVVRYLSEIDAWRLIRGISLGVLLWVCFAFVLQVNLRIFVPRSVPVLFGLLAIVLLVGGRFIAKRLLRGRLGDLPRVLIFGAGSAGTQAAAMMKVSETRTVMGFLDDSAAIQSRRISGLTVYPTGRASELVAQMSVDEIVLAVPSATEAQLSDIVSRLKDSGAALSSVPTFHALVAGTSKIENIEPVDIGKLVGRQSVDADENLIAKTLAGKTVLVTGAGGSIGSELCRLILSSSVEKLVLYEANEFALYSVKRDLASSLAIPVLGSVTDADALFEAVRDNDVDIIFHAAAHKHVPLLEDNVIEAIRNNVLGARVVVDVAGRAGVSQTVLISSDKAVRPTNVMGATKRWAELIFQAAAAERKGLFCAVRFGNVLGSNGSVIPLFQEQIAKGGPVTVTDPTMTRYFMSIREAAELIVQAAGLSTGGDTFLLDMGDPVAIGDLAKNLILLSGLTPRDEKNPHGDIEIRVIGARPGEKKHEELFYDADKARKTAHPKISRASESPVPADLSIALEELLTAVSSRNNEIAKATLFRAITG